MSLSNETSGPVSDTGVTVTGKSSVSDAEMDEILQKIGEKVLSSVKKGTFVLTSSGDTVTLTACPGFVISDKADDGGTSAVTGGQQSSNETVGMKLKQDIVYIIENAEEDADEEVKVKMDTDDISTSELTSTSELSPNEIDTQSVNQIDSQNGSENNNHNDSQNGSENNNHYDSQNGSENNNQNDIKNGSENNNHNDSQNGSENNNHNDSVNDKHDESTCKYENTTPKAKSKKASTCNKKDCHDKTMKMPCECAKNEEAAIKRLLTCGACLKRFGTICKLHIHMATHSLGSSYRFDHVSSTGYPKFDTFSSFSQTGCELLDDNSCTVEFNSVDCQTELTMLEGRFDEVQQRNEVKEIDIKCLDEIPEKVEQIHRVAKEVHAVANETRENNDVSEKYPNLVKVLVFDKKSQAVNENVEKKRKRKQLNPKLCTSVNGYEPEEIKSDTVKHMKSDSVGTAEVEMAVDAPVEEGNQEIDNSVEEEAEKYTVEAEAKDHGLVTDKNPEGFCYLGGFDKKFVIIKPTRGNSCKNPGVKRKHRAREPKAAKEKPNINAKRIRCKKGVNSKKLDNRWENNTENVAGQSSESVAKKTVKAPIKRVFCEICKKNVWASEMARHQLKHDAPEVDVMCEKCGKTCSNRSQLHKHLMTHRDTKPHKCTFCPAQFSAKKEYTIHIANHKGDRPHVCNVCDKRFLTIKSLLQHQENVHMGLTKFQCTHCERRFFKHSGLQAHMATHFDASHGCNYCERKFRDKTSLRRHERIHTGIKMYQCHICTHAYNQCTPFFVHMEKKHFMSRAVVKEQLQVVHEANRRLGKKPQTLMLPIDVDSLKEDLDKGGTGEIELLKTEQFIQSVCPPNGGAMKVFRKRKEPSQLLKKHIANENAATEMIRYEYCYGSSSPDEFFMETENSHEATVLLAEGQDSLEASSAVNNVYRLHIPDPSSVYSQSSSQTETFGPPNRMIITKNKRIILKPVNQEFENYMSSIHDSASDICPQSGYIESISVPAVSHESLSTVTLHNGQTAISVPFYSKQQMDYTNLSNLTSLASSSVYQGE